MPRPACIAAAGGRTAADNTAAANTGAGTGQCQHLLLLLLLLLQAFKDATAWSHTRQGHLAATAAACPNRQQARTTC
jgi:hypothetical protein